MLSLRLLGCARFLSKSCTSLVAAGILFSLVGCAPLDEPPPRLGATNWKPGGIGGPVEVHPLPPSKEVLADYEAWRASDVTRKARVYEATLYGSNQFHFVVGVSGGDTGLGYTEETEASFLYKDPLRGDYEIFWNRRGRHDLGFMNLGETSKVVWLRPNGLTNANGDPQLKIVAFEGLEPDWGTGIYAEPGGRTN